MATRKPKKERSHELLTAALDVAELYGYKAMTRAQIAARAGVSDGLVTQRLGTMPEVQRKVMRHAIAERRLRIVAQGIVNRDRHALKAPADLQNEALAALGRV